MFWPSTLDQTIRDLRSSFNEGPKTSIFQIAQSTKTIMAVGDAKKMTSKENSRTRTMLSSDTTWLIKHVSGLKLSRGVLELGAHPERVQPISPSVVQAELRGCSVLSTSSAETSSPFSMAVSMSCQCNFVPLRCRIGWSRTIL